MSYTLEQKEFAQSVGSLWWRFPNEHVPIDKAWSLCLEDVLSAPGAEYHIGPTPPRVLSELEGELLEALKEVFEQCDGYVPNTSKATWRKAAAAIQKAESTP